jgi:NitT/TauT family transport system substrate-binding protein
MRLVQVRSWFSAPRIALALLSVVLLVSGCEASGTAASSSGNSPITVAVVPGIDNAPLRVAAQDGLFRSHGLDVTIVNYKSLSPAVQALRAGRANIVAGDYADLFYDEASGRAKLRLIADGYDAVPNLTQILTLPGSGITKPQDLENKTVATPVPQEITDSGNAPNSMEALAAQSVLQSDGVSPSSVTWKPTPAQDMISELNRGKVSAILVTEPYIFEAESQLGATGVLDAYSGVTAGLPLSGYFSLSSYARTDAATVTEFKAALAEAQAASGMRGPVEQVLTTSTGMSAEDAAMTTIGVYPTFLSVGQLQRVAQLMYDAGMIDNSLNVSRMISG